ncbi:MAG: FAD-dependent monooxygenase, partial [Leucothrix sp.]
MSIEPVDVMIVGGGMVGASLAVALSSLPLKIALVESFPFQLTQQPGYDDRAIALSYGSSQILQGMGIWNEVSAVANPIDSIHVSDRGHFGATRLNAKQHNVPALGYLVEAQVYSQVLHTYLEQREVRLIQPAHIQNIEPADNGVIVSIDCEGVITKWQSRLLVACDGANSTVREMVGVSATTKDYGQTALIANVTTEVPHNNQAFE